MKKKISSLILFFSMCDLFSNVASASAISLMGVSDSSNISASNKTLGSQAAYGGGILFNFPLAMRMSFETGALYFNRNWTDTTLGNNNLTSQVLQVPFLFRIHLRFISIGAGGYYSANQGNLSESGTFNNSNLTYTAYGINPYDFGLLGDVGIHIPLSRGVVLRFDARYLNGVSNVAINTANTYFNRDFQILGGLTFTLSESSRRQHSGSER